MQVNLVLYNFVGKFKDSNFIFKWRNTAKNLGIIFDIYLTCNLYMYHVLIMLITYFIPLSIERSIPNYDLPINLVRSNTILYLTILDFAQNIENNLHYTLVRIELYEPVTMCERKIKLRYKSFSTLHK